MQFAAMIQWKLVKKEPSVLDQYKKFVKMYSDEYYQFININQIFTLIIPVALVEKTNIKVPRKLHMKNTFILEDVSFQSLSEIIPQIGGFASSLMAAFFILFGYFINK